VQGDQTRCSVSGQFDRRVRSSRKSPSEGTNGYILLWGYKYLWWPALAGAWHPWDLVSMLWESYESL
jgi:hypothetical protein